MQIYDISQEVFGCVVFPGDHKPEKTTVLSTENGDVCNLTAISMCAHNGTHIDAPFHFIPDGEKVDEISLSSVVGMTYVAEKEGAVTKDDAEIILKKAKEINPEASKRILIKGDCTVTLEAAEVFAEAGILLLGNESQTVGPKDAPMAVHKVLLGKGVVLLEGIRLNNVPVGVYLLNAAPLNFAGIDGSPCRSILIEM